MPTTPDIQANGQPVFEVQLQALSEGRDGNGVAGQSDLKVTDGTGDNESDIATGTAYYDGTSSTLGSTDTKTHSDGDSNNDRWDLIAYDVSTDSVTLSEGTAESNPTPPSLSANEVLLALVYIESQQTDFGSDAIVNFRVLGGTGIIASDDGTEKVSRVQDINGKNGIQISDGGGGEATVETDPGNALGHDGSNQIEVTSDSIQTGELDLSITPTWTGKHQFNSGIDTRGDLEDDTTTIWDSTGGHIEQSALENSSVTVAGNSVSLGNSTAVAAGDLSNVSVSSPSAGQTLLYHATNSQYENAGVTAGTGVSKTTGDASLTLSLDESVLKDGGGKEIDVADLAGGLGTADQLPLSDGSAVSWGTAPNAALTNDTITRTAGDGLKYSSGAAGTALGGSATLAVEPADFAGAGLADDGSDNLTPDTSDEGTVTATGGSQPAVNTTVSTTLSQTDAYDVILYVDSDPAFNADYQFNWDYAHVWDDSTSTLKLDLTVNWDTDPGGGNDVTLHWEVIKR